MIVNRKHSEYQRYALIFIIISSSLQGIIIGAVNQSVLNSTFFMMSIVLAAVALIVVYYLSFRNIKKIKKSYGANKIEINESGITIGDRFISVEEIKSVIAVDPEAVAKQGETVSDFIKLLKGKALPYCMKIQISDGWERFDFVFDSYYMGVQLMKILKSWRDRKIPVTFIEEYSEEMLAYPDSELST